MVRRLAAFAVVAIVALGNLTICPAGQCPLMQGASRDCCAKGPGLKGLDCCPEVGQRNAPRLVAATAMQSVTAPQALPHPFGVFIPASPPSSEETRSTWIARGPAPPGSLLDLRTSLLL